MILPQKVNTFMTKALWDLLHSFCMTQIGMTCYMDPLIKILTNFVSTLQMLNLFCLNKNMLSLEKNPCLH